METIEFFFFFFAFSYFLNNLIILFFNMESKLHNKILIRNGSNRIVYLVLNHHYKSGWKIYWTAVTIATIDALLVIRCNLSNHGKLKQIRMEEEDGISKGNLDLFVLYDILAYF